MKKMILAAAMMLSLMTAGPAAQAGDIDLSIGIGIPGLMFGGPPAYYEPPPPPRVIVVPRPIYVSPPPAYYYDRHAYKHAEKRWRKQQKRAWKEYRHGRHGDHDD